MSKKLVAGIVAGVVVVAAIVAAVLLWPRRFTLDTAYYGKSAFSEIDAEQLRELIEQKKSFALLIYQPSCQASEDFEKVLADFSEKKQVGFEKISFSTVKKTGLIEGLKYYPSVALYHDGKLVDFLKTDDDDDLAAYQSEAGFAEWWGRYIKE